MITNKTRRRILIGIITLLFVTGILLLGLPWGIQTLTVLQLEKISGHNILLKNVSIHYIDRAVTLTGLQMVDRNSSRPMVTIDQLQVYFRLMPLLQMKIYLPRVLVEHPVISMIRSRDGTLNVMHLKQNEDDSKDSGFIIAIKELQLNEGIMTYQDLTRPANPRLQIDGINLQISNFSTDREEPIPIRLQANLAEKGRVAANGDIHMTPFSLESRWEMKEALLSPYQNFIPGFPLLSGSVNSSFTLRVPPENSSPIMVQGNMVVHDFKMGPQSSPFLAGSSMEVSNIDFFWPDHLTIASILARQVTLEILRDKHGVLPVLASFGGQNSHNAGSNHEPKDFIAKINEILINESTIHFINQSIQPEYRKQLSQVMIKLNNITSEPEQTGRIVATASTPEEETMKMEGDIRMLGGEFFLKVDGTVQDVVIPSFNPYAEKLLGWGTRSGQLNTKFQVKVEEQRLKSTNKISISDLRVVRAEAEDLVDRKLGLPLGLIVDLIKNIHGDIHLKIKVDGQLNNPEFSIRNAIWKSLRNAVINIAAAPLRLIGHLVKGNTKIQKIDIHPILFKAGTKTMIAGMDERIQNLQKFLKETPYINLQVQPVMSPDDLKMLRIIEVTSRIAELESREPSLNGIKAVQALYNRKFPGKKFPEDSEREVALLEELVEAEAVPTMRAATLSSDRSDRVIDMLTSVHGISPSRFHRKEFKENSSPGRSGGLEFSIIR